MNYLTQASDFRNQASNGRKSDGKLTAFSQHLRSAANILHGCSNIIYSIIGNRFTFVQFIGEALQCRTLRRVHRIAK